MARAIGVPLSGAGNATVGGASTGSATPKGTGASSSFGTWIAAGVAAVVVAGALVAAATKQRRLLRQPPLGLFVGVWRVGTRGATAHFARLACFAAEREHPCGRGSVSECAWVSGVAARPPGIGYE